MIHVTHDQVEALTLGDRVAVLDAGTLQQVGTPDEVYRRPRNRFVAGFLGVPRMNFLEPDQARCMPPASPVGRSASAPEHIRLDGDVVDRVDARRGRGQPMPTSTWRAASSPRRRRGRPAPQGDDVRVGIRPEDVHLFDAGDRRAGGAGMSERRQLALLLAPYVLGLSLLVAAPALVTFALSVTEYDLVGAPSFVGLDNYRELLEDDVFRIAVTNSLVFAAIAVPLRLAAALGLALLLHRRMVGVGVYRAGVRRPDGRSRRSPTASSGSGSSTRSTGRSTRSSAGAAHRAPRGSGIRCRSG